MTISLEIFVSIFHGRSYGIDAAASYLLLTNSPTADIKYCAKNKLISLAQRQNG